MNPIGWLLDLPEVRDLGDHKWHAYILFKAKVPRVLDLYDTLVCRGYSVLHARHSVAGPDTLEKSAGVILVPPPDGAEWLQDLPSLREHRHAVVDPNTGSFATQVLNAMWHFAGATPAQAAKESAERVDRLTGDALKTLSRLSGLPSPLGPEWEATPVLANRLAETLIEGAKYSEAIAVLQQVGESFAETVRWQQLIGLAYRRLGDVRNALLYLKGFYDRGHRDPESMGIYASALMDLYDRVGSREDLKRSRDLYSEAFDASPADSYTGINAASKSVFLGDLPTAERYLKQVREVVEPQINDQTSDYWLLFTAAEIQLLLKNYPEAARLYHDAVIKSPDKIGSHLSAWLQARRLMDQFDTPKEHRDAVWHAFQHITDAAPGANVLEPPCRRLRVFAFDPSMGRHLQTAPLTEVTLKIPWESQAPDGKSALSKGPVGEYLEVVDYDPGSLCFYEPVDLDDQRLVASDGLAPSEGNPQFHQQMVYAVAMNLIDHFERALGRKALWADHQNAAGEPEFVQRLRIYPHALREANAYYSPEKKALLFGYFRPETEQTDNYGTVFTCLSHDVIAHEMSHALLDGLHPRFTEPSNGDVFAFHEAFADLVALFQHFSHAEVLLHEIARTRSDLGTENLLGQLAQQFGRAIGRHGALRDALGARDKKTGEWRPSQPSPRQLERAHEAHDRGAILVAAIFDAFLSIYKSRIADLLRIATQGSGILAPGALHPDLVGRLAATAAKIATHFLRLCIRALDYCPPVDITLGDYLRALITADLDFMPHDRYNYRLALLEAFERRGIYPKDVRNISLEGLVWRPPRREVDLSTLFGKGGLVAEWRAIRDRKTLWQTMRQNVQIVENWVDHYCSTSFGDELGLALSTDAPRSVYRDGSRTRVEVHSVRLARRITPHGGAVTDLIVEIIQRRRGYFDADRQKTVDKSASEPPEGDFTFYGGCTLLIDPSDHKVRYAITKHVLSDSRLKLEREFRDGRTSSTSLRATYFGDPDRESPPRERFALLHGGF